MCLPVVRELRILKGMEPEEVETLQDRYTKVRWLVGGGISVSSKP